MMKNLMETMFRNQEDSMKMKVWSIILLIGFALLSVLVFVSKISFNNIMIYLIAFAKEERNPSGTQTARTTTGKRSAIDNN